MSADANRFEGFDPVWHAILTGTHPHLIRGRRFFKLISPRVIERCQLCFAPFAGIAAPLLRRLGYGPWQRNPHYCDKCEQFFREHRGGTELEIAVVYADVRGSTALAARMSPAEFGTLMQRFYLTATKVLTDDDAAIDKMVGDEVIGLFIPGLVHDDYRRRAALSALKLLRATGHGSLGGPWLPIGIGVHAGKAFVGSLGVEGGAYEFAALGDTMNLGARLVEAAEAGELVISDAVWPHVRDSLKAEARRLELKGVDQPMTVHAARVESLPQ